MFTKMRMAGCHPDVITYTAMIHPYDVAGNCNFDVRDQTERCTFELKS